MAKYPPGTTLKDFSFHGNDSKITKLYSVQNRFGLRIYFKVEEPIICEEVFQLLQANETLGLSREGGYPNIHIRCNEGIDRIRQILDVLKNNNYIANEFAVEIYRHFSSNLLVDAYGALIPQINDASSNSAVPRPVISISILDSITQLQLFSNQVNVASIINRLSILEMPESSADEVVGLLRRDLQDIVGNVSNATSLKETAYNTLLTLAEAYPVNDHDVFTLEPIAIENRVVITTGHQFDLNLLVHYHKNRNRRNTREFSDFGPEGKLLCNPITNFAFSTEDAAHIKRIAAERGLTLDDNIALSASSFFRGGATRLSRHFMTPNFSEHSITAIDRRNVQEISRGVSISTRRADQPRTITPPTPEEISQALILSGDLYTISDLSHINDTVVLRALVRAEILSVVRDGIYTVADLASRDAGFIHGACRPELIHFIRRGILTKAEILSWNCNEIHARIAPACLQAIREGLFTMADLNNLDHCGIHYLTCSESLQALRDGIFTVQDFVASGISSEAIRLLILFPHGGGLQALRDRLFVVSDVLGFNDKAIFDLVTTPALLQAMKDGFVTMADFRNMVNHHANSLLCNARCLEALHDELFTVADLLQMDVNAIAQVIQPECLQALNDGQTTIAALIRLNAGELMEANETNHYPSPRRRLNT